MNRKDRRLVLIAVLIIAAIAGTAAAATAIDNPGTTDVAERTSEVATVQLEAAETDGENETQDESQAESTEPAPGETSNGAASEAENESGDSSAEDAAEGPDIPITGPDLERATQAALEYLGEGRVTETEIEDEESYYEVEVTLANGRQIDVQLDEAFKVVGTD